MTGEIQYIESQSTSRIAEQASMKLLRNENVTETVARSQKRCRGLQKSGRAECRIPVRFRFVTPAEADPALIIAYANACSRKKEKVQLSTFPQPLRSSSSKKSLSKYVC